MIHYVYETTNLINSKTYIGIHSTSNIDDGYMGSGLHLKRAFNKYGKSNFKKTVIFEGKCRDDVVTVERLLVTEAYCNRNDTYNLMTGGGNTNSKMSDETKVKMSIAKIGSTHDTETKIKIGDSHRGRVHSVASRLNMSDGQKSRKRDPRLGCKHSDESKAKMSKLKKGKKQPTATCKYCGLVASCGNIGKYHNENCKYKNKGV